MYSVTMRRKSESIKGPSSSLRERAYSHIQQLIASGGLESGSAISELQLAQTLGSSRTPIREAMSRLAAQGLLEQSPGGGMVVAQVQREDIVELHELREALELYAVRKAAHQPMQDIERVRIQKTIEQIGELTEELREGKKPVLNEAQMHRFLTADLCFHALLVSFAHNSRLQKMISETRLLINVFSLKRRGHDIEKLQDIQRYHQSILEAVLGQDADAATKALGDHLAASQRERLQEYDHSRREASLREHVPAIF